MFPLAGRWSSDCSDAPIPDHSKQGRAPTTIPGRVRIVARVGAQGLTSWRRTGARLDIGALERPLAGVRNLSKAIIVLGLAQLCGSLHGAAPPSGIHWPRGQLLPSFAPPTKLDVVDLLRAPGDLRLLMASLQGVVNREEPRLYLLEPAEEGARTWLADLKLPTEMHADPFALVEKYRSSVRGLVVYDPEMPDSVNVATTLAGLKDALVASPEIAGRLGAGAGGIPVLDDLRGRFESRLEAYTWQFENLWASVDRRMLIGLAPGRTGRTRSGLPLGFVSIAEQPAPEHRAANRKTYALDFSGQLGGEFVYVRFQDAFPRDGWGAAVGRVAVLADGAPFAEFTAGHESERPFLFDPQRSQVAAGGSTFRFADNDRHFTYRFAPPPGTRRLTASVEMWNEYRVSAGAGEPRMPWRPTGNLRDYAMANRAIVFWLDANAPAERGLMQKIFAAAGPGTPYLGWFGNDIEGEFGGVELASRHGVYVVPADWFNNLSVFSGTRLEQAHATPRTPPVLDNKIYVTFTFGEGDNLQYNQHRLRVLWDDPARGKVPVNWTSTPLLLDAAPAILDYYRRTATPNDRLLAGPSGVGYFYPEPWPDDHLGTFIRQTRSYVERSGMTIPYVLNRIGQRDRPLDSASVASYRDDYAAPGVLLGWGGTFGTEIIDGIPVSTIRGIGSVAEGIHALESAREQWDGRSPLFLSVGVFAWKLRPSDIAELVAALGPEFEPVLADTYFALLREAHGLPEP